METRHEAGDANASTPIKYNDAGVSARKYAKLQPQNIENQKSMSPNKKKTRKRRTVRVHTWRLLQKQQFQRAFGEVFANTWLSDTTINEELTSKVAKHVLCRSASEVEDFIKNFTVKIKHHRYVNYGPIDRWFEVIEALSHENEDLEKQLGHVMLAAKEEPLESCDEAPAVDPTLPQPDYDSIYTYMSCALANKELPALSPIDSLVVEDCVQSLAYQIQCLNDDELRRSLRNVYIHLTKKPDQEQEENCEEVRKNMLHNANLFNPLGLNAQAIVPVIPE